MSLFYEHILTNTFDIKRTNNKLEKIYKSMALDETFLSYLGGINNNDLINILNTNRIDNYEPQLIRRSSYYDSDKFTELIQTNKS